MGRQVTHKALHPTTIYALPDTIRTTLGVAFQVAEGDYQRWGLMGLVSRTAARFVGLGELDCTLIIDALVHDELALPEKPPADGAEDHGGIVAVATDRGWEVTAPRAWMTFRREIDGHQVAVHVLFEMWSDADTGVLYHRDPQTHTARYDWWRKVFGVAYTGTPGYAGAQTMRVTLAGRRGGAGVTLQPKNAFEVPEWTGAELPYLRSQWERPSVPGSWEHGYDANLAYLSAASVSLLAPHPLLKTGKREFDPGLSGWWLCSLGKLQVPELERYLPDPAGYGKQASRGRRWLATPTVKLISELADAGVHGGITIHDSYTGPGIALLKPWADVMSKEISGFRALMSDERAARRNACKKAITYGIGMLRRQGGITRPDWHATIVAGSRTNLWRKLHRVFETHGIGPVRINNDCVWFTSDIADPLQAFPGVGSDTDRPLFRLGDRPDQLGRFKVEGSISIEIEEKA